MKYRPRRYQTDVSASLNVGLQTYRAKIHDITPHATRLTAALKATRNDTVTIEHLGRKHPGKLCWQRDGSCGVIFKTRLSTKQLESMLTSGKLRK